jgi:purine/pyrimidine-nucleoside phosphorylase
MASISHNAYFDGGVQSLGFEHRGHRSTVGVIAPGTYHFDTDAPERMTVIVGELEVLLPGATDWDSYRSGTVFEIPGSSGFEVRSTSPSAYLCEFL